MAKLFLKKNLDNNKDINTMSPQSIQNIYNFLKLSNSIATSGQPTAEQFSAIKAAGYQVVVNLALPESTNALPDEKNIVEAQGMQYIHIPVIWEKPTIEDVKDFFSIMKANADKTLFIHCAANMRVSAFMYLYRRIHQHISEEEAKQNLHQIWVPNEVWQEFIKQVIDYYR